MMKMSYEEFKNKFQKELMDLLEPGCTFEERVSFLPNRHFEVFSVKKPSAKNGVGISLNLEELFMRYQSLGSFSKVLKSTANLVNSERRLSRCRLDDVFADVKEKVFPCLINTDLNKEYLDTVPHRTFLDLSIIYKMKVAGAGGTVIIDNAALERIGMTEDELYLTALVNMVGVNGISVNDIDSKLQGKDESGKNVYYCRKELASMELPAVGAIPVYCVEDANKRNGSSAFLVPELWRGVAQSIGESVYILPSSLHELLFMKRSACEHFPYLIQTIREINETEVAVEDFLSDNLYFYDKDTGEISIVT